MSRAAPPQPNWRPVPSPSPSREPETLLEVDSVVRRYGATVALDEVSFEIRRGETLGLLGANGAGKTTLMHLLAGLTEPNAGHIRFSDGATPTNAAVRRRIGIAFQDLAIYPELTVEENIVFFARLHGLSGPALSDAVDEAIARVELGERRRMRAHTLSGGMLRRLNLACAIVHQPEVLLLDEPTAAMDPQSRVHLLEGLERIAQGGTTLVVSTHLLDEAERLCDRIAILDRGHLVAMGTLAELSSAHGGGMVEVELEKASDGRAVHLRWMGDQPFEDALRLLKGHEKLRRLRVQSASLETVYFALTGRRLDD